MFTGLTAWLGEILDITRGIDEARADVGRIRTPAAATAALWFDAALLLIWLGLWFRYDLYSTSAYFEPIVTDIVNMADVKFQAVLMIVGRFIFNLGPTLIQWRYPALAGRHKGVYWAFMLAVGFDIVTDFPLVFEDVDRFFGSLLTSAATYGLDGVAHYGLAFIGVFFASFVFQSLFVIQAAKVLMLIGWRRSLLTPAYSAQMGD